MLHVELDNIFTEEDALTHIKDIFEHVETTKELYVITKGGRPVLAIIDIDRLEADQGRVTMPTPIPTTPLTTQPPVPAAAFETAPLVTSPATPEVSITPIPVAPVVVAPAPLPEAAWAAAVPPPAAVPVEPPAVPITQSPQAPVAAPTAPTLPDMPDTDLSNDSPLA